MNRFSQSVSAPALTSRIRSERDVIATCVHLLGYWPRNSLVLVVTDGQGVGPLIRVDLADPADVSLEDYLEISFGSIPRRGDDHNGDRRVFVVLFGEKTGSYSDVPPGKPAQPVTETDQILLDRAGHYMSSLGVVSSRCDVEILDVIVVGHCTYWAVAPEEGALAPVGWVSEIFSSPVYAELVARGSVVSGSSYEAYDAKKWNPLESSDLKATERWLMLSEVAANSYLAQKCSLSPLEPFQAEAELMLWDNVLGVVSDLLDAETAGEESDFLYRGDRLRHLIPPDAAGYLVASLNNSATLHYVVYLACSGIEQTLQALKLLDQHIPYFLSVAEQSSCRLLPKRETLSTFGLEGLNPLWSESQNRNEEHNERAGSHFAGMISGALTTAPNWARLEALECLCALFENVASYKPESMFIAAQAWVRWFWGNSTSAAHILEGADPRYLESSPLLLQSLLDNSVIPLWLTEPGGAPPRS